MKRLLLTIFVIQAFVAFSVVLPLRAQTSGAADSADSQAAARDVANSALSASVLGVGRDVLKVLQARLAWHHPGCFYCAGEEQAPKACADAYSDLYSKPNLDFRVTLGYTDHTSKGMVTAEDGPHRAAWVDKLKQPCPPNAVGTCGFEQIDNEHFVKKNVEGPNGEKHTVNLYLVSSSYSVDDQANRLKQDPSLTPAQNSHRLAEMQAKQSLRAKNNFIEGLKSADVNIYAGHARVGGGPSFEPPCLKKNSFYVDETCYADHASEKEMLDVLRSNPHPPKLIGMIACESGRLFSDKIRDATKDSKGKNLTGVVTSKGLSEPEVGFGQAFSMLDSVLAFRCQPEFSNALGELPNYNPAHTTGLGAQIDGFFTDPHPAMLNSTPIADQSAVPDQYRTEKPLEPLIHPTAWDAPAATKVQRAGSVK